MFTYKHKKTGVVITTYGKVTGENWEQEKAEKKGHRKPADPPKQDENAHDEDEQE